MDAIACTLNAHQSLLTGMPNRFEICIVDRLSGGAHGKLL